MSFELPSGGFTGGRSAIVDTGGLLTAIPRWIWADVWRSEAGTYPLAGLNPDPGCVVPARCAGVRAVLFDSAGHRSRVLELPAFLLSRNDVPLVAGVGGLLDEFELSVAPGGHDARLVPLPRPRRA